MSEDNPADFASRGLSPNAYEKVRMWFNAPGFLWKGEEDWPVRVITPTSDDDQEVKPTVLAVNKVLVSEEFDLLTTLETQFSSWYHLVRRMALITKFITITRARVNKKCGKRTRRSLEKTNKTIKCVLSMQDICDAEKLVIKLTQRKYLSTEVSLLSKLQSTEKSKLREARKLSALSKLNPFINSERKM